jgi:hypothetical protein
MRFSWPQITRDRSAAAIFSVALIVRLVAYVMRVQSVPIWPAGWPGPNMWGDAVIYQTDLANILHGLVPYKDFSFNYGPLYLYSMVPFYLVSPLVSYIPTVFADAATSVVVYLVTKQTTKDTTLAGVAGVAYAAFPFAIINEGYLWMSSQPMTLFMLLAVYFAVKKSPFASMCSLAVAAMFKQEALFIVIPLILFNVRTDLMKSIKGIAASVGLYVAGVAPFLAVAPLETIYSLMYGRWIDFGSAPGYGMPLAPFQQGASAIANICTYTTYTLTGAFTGSVCGAIVNTTAFTSPSFLGPLTEFTFLIMPWIIIIASITLLAVRKSPVLLQLSSVFTMLMMLYLFSYLVHSVIAYYFLPVYALMLAAATNKTTTVIGILAAILVSFTPEGELQLLVPTIAILAITIAESMRLEKVSPSSSRSSLPSSPQQEQAP